MLRKPLNTMFSTHFRLNTESIGYIVSKVLHQMTNKPQITGSTGEK